MSSAALDRLLAILLVALLASGLLTLRSGAPATAPLFWFHGVAGGALLVAATVKLRRSVGPAVRRRRWGRLALGALLTLLVAASLAGGFAWVASGRILSIGPWTILTLHVWAALAADPRRPASTSLPRRFRLLRPRAGRPARSAAAPSSRRGGLAARSAPLPGEPRTSLDAITGGDAPLHRLTLASRRRHPTADDLLRRGHARRRPRVLAPARRRARRSAARARSGRRSTALGTTERDATLDCTSGWALRTPWRGTPIRGGPGRGRRRPDRTVRPRPIRHRLERQPRARRARRCPPRHARRGRPLPAANGAPVRLVAPGRRGLDWIKWVASIEVA